MTRSDWSGGVNFGLYASDLNGGFADAGLPPGNGTVNLEYANPDAGHMLILRATDASGTSVMDYAAGNYYSLNTWYHNLIEYDSTNRCDYGNGHKHDNRQCDSRVERFGTRCLECRYDKTWWLTLSIWRGRSPWC